MTIPYREGLPKSEKLLKIYFEVHFLNILMKRLLKDLGNENVYKSTSVMRDLSFLRLR
jgi:hypothetical protein